MRHQIIGCVSKERVDANGGGDKPPGLPESELIVGRDDHCCPCIAPICHIQPMEFSDEMLILISVLTPMIPVLNLTLN